MIMLMTEDGAELNKMADAWLQVIVVARKRSDDEIECAEVKIDGVTIGEWQCPRLSHQRHGRFKPTAGLRALLRDVAFLFGSNEEIAAALATRLARVCGHPSDPANRRMRERLLRDANGPG